MAREEKDLIEEELKKYPRYAGVAANVVAIREGLDANNFNPNSSTIRWVIREIESKLADGLAQTFCDWSTQTGFANTIANQNLLLEAITEAGQPVTLEALVFLSDQLQDNLSANPERSQILQTRQTEFNEIKERNDLIADECARLVDRNGKPRASLGTPTTSPAQVLRTRTAEIRAKSLDELRQLKARRDHNRELREKPVEELRALAKAEFEAQRPSHTQYAPLPEKWTPPGKDESCAVPLTRGLLIRLDPKTLRSLTAKYGNAAIDEILNQSRRS